MGVQRRALQKIEGRTLQHGLARDASKVGLVGLVRILTDKKFDVIDCQLPSDHLFSLGAQSIPRTDFIAHLRLALDAVDTPGLWDIEFEGLKLS